MSSEYASRAIVHLLYEVAEKTTDDVLSIAGAREEVGQTRAMLETVLSMLTHVHDAANGLDHRKRQVDQAEERLARAEPMRAEEQAGCEWRADQERRAGLSTKQSNQV